MGTRGFTTLSGLIPGPLVVPSASSPAAETLRVGLLSSHSDSWTSLAGSVPVGAARLSRAGPRLPSFLGKAQEDLWPALLPVGPHRPSTVSSTSTLCQSCYLGGHA